MEQDGDFSKATRRLLFKEPEKTKIPGAGRSAAERPERHVRTKVTINIDGDIIAFFKERAKEDGRPYQTLMNQVLREYVSGSRTERVAEQVANLLADDEGFLEILRDKVSGER